MSATDSQAFVELIEGWEMVKSAVERIGRALADASEGSLTESERYDLQQDVYNLCSHATNAQIDCAKAGLFLTAREYKKRRDREVEQTQEEFGKWEEEEERRKEMALRLKHLN